MTPATDPVAQVMGIPASEENTATQVERSPTGRVKNVRQKPTKYPEWVVDEETLRRFNNDEGPPPGWSEDGEGEEGTEELVGAE